MTDAENSQAPTAHSGAPPRARFQVSLRDLLFSSAIIAVGLSVFLPFLTYGRVAWFPEYVGPEARGTMLAGGLLLVFLALLGIFCGVCVVQYLGWSGWRRAVLLTTAIAIFWTPVLAIKALIPNFIRSNMAANESKTIASCKQYAEAQDIYRRTDWDADGTLEYAQSLLELSRRKGTDKNSKPLLPQEFAAAEGMPGVAKPLHGYDFKVLMGQGSNVPGGQKSYLVPSADGKSFNLIYGYAFAACPAEYGFTGINSFIINNTGTVYQFDLGADSARKFEEMTEFNLPKEIHWGIPE